jgi:hypothetical protein
MTLIYSYLCRLAIRAVGAVVFIWATWVAGKRSERQAASLRAATAYADTRKDIDHATDNLGDDPAVLREWLRERGKPTSRM